MTANIGSLVVSLGLDAAEYVAGLTKSEYQARKFARELGDQVTNAVALMATLGGSAVAAVAALDRAAGTIASYQDLAEKIGDTAESVISLQRASDLSGTGLDQVAAASVKLTATLSKQDDESKGAALALAAINIPLEEFKRLGAVAQIDRVAQQLAKFEDGAGKTAIAVELFGRSGAELLPFLNDLAEAGRVNARITREQIEAADRFTKDIGRLRGELKQWGMELTAGVLPPAQRLLTTLRALHQTSIIGFLTTAGVQTDNPMRAAAELEAYIQRQRKLRDELDPKRGFVYRLNDILSGDVGDISRQIAVAQRQQDYLVALIKLQNTGGTDVDAQDGGFYGEALLQRGNRGGKPTDTAKKVIESQRYLETLTNQLQATQDLNAAATALAEIESGRLGVLTAAQRDNILVTAQRIDQARIEAQQEREREELARATVEAQKRVVAEAAAIVESTQTPFERLNQELTRLQWLLDNGYIGWETFARATLDAQERAEKTAVAVRRQAAEWDAFAKNAARGIQEHLGDGLFNAMKGNFDNIGQSFADMVLRMVAEAQAAQIARYLLGDLVQGGEGKGVAGSLFSSLLQGVFGGGKAGGGPVDAGRIYRVAENRPEMLDVNGKQFLLMGRQRGHIDPNPRVGGRVVQVTNHFVINGPASRMSQQQIAAAAGQSIGRAVKRLH